MPAPADVSRAFWNIQRQTRKNTQKTPKHQNTITTFSIATPVASPMASSKKKRKPSSSLLSRRQTAAAAVSKPLPSKLSRKLIRSHHTAQKRLSQAIQQNDSTAITTLTTQLTTSGGLAAYQRASVSGQSSQRGGDSSRILTDWFTSLGIPKPKDAASSSSSNSPLSAFRLLEIGCLSPANAIHSYFPAPRRTLLDLNSLHPEILKQDFMSFPVPASAESGYDIISCSLVLNYVPTPAGRGDMLKHISRFMEQGLARRELRLQKPRATNKLHKEELKPVSSDDDWDEWFPALFFVLPAPCVTNSRYLTGDKLEEIMASMGYEEVRKKVSPKLVYYLYRYHGNGTGGKFKKVELLPGGKRNNFAIVVE
ncbi:hypothetical protein H072_5418 [Dactylellina haptotyla CBS 200.50]|uniref:25S rRNA adenine-N(1) methyltransferase n=1 Tax=Dactylellina haptotyla (strain CBS 200.50) TaxID=1284197 RepID=S8BZ99_DACHA|nr:hypothetical protein H072_5418 [Dactylellina haptotyla CBS 200.50]